MHSSSKLFYSLIFQVVIKNTCSKCILYFSHFQNGPKKFYAVYTLVRKYIEHWIKAWKFGAVTLLTKLGSWNEFSLS